MDTVADDEGGDMILSDKNTKVELKGTVLDLIVEFRMLTAALHMLMREQFSEETALRVLDETYRNGKADANEDEQQT